MLLARYWHSFTAFSIALRLRKIELFLKYLVVEPFGISLKSAKYQVSPTNSLITDTV